ncbi:hypothetical protein KKF84_16445 [Myxococcota bacterium]|nr:hypothetical protein [Myxococcota bacterium]MBU1536916.1 hypothetical protein [Myxococcota bacterium]
MKHLSAVLLILLLTAPHFACDDDTSGPCGNKQIDEGEECDSYNLNGESCITQGFYGGTLECTDNCTLSLNQCAANGSCGDGVIQIAFGEECDGEILGDTCATLGFGAGELSCSDQCRFDVSQCTGTAFCGDGVIEGVEECEGADLDGQSCQTLGYSGGTLGCDSLCLFDKSGCTE